MCFSMLGKLGLRCMMSRVSVASRALAKNTGGMRQGTRSTIGRRIFRERTSTVR